MTVPATNNVAAVFLALPLIFVVFPICLYLLTLTIAAPFGLSRLPLLRTPHHRFAILIPARNEELVLGRLLGSLRSMNYPPGLYDIWVVADNCSDNTAMIARSCGARVRERYDETKAAKGYALSWLLATLENEHQRYDAYVVLDADSVVSSGFLSAMDARLAAGEQILQSYYTVLPVRQTRVELLREASFALVHFLRPTAKTFLGASAGLKGNGMCFSRAVIDRFGWPSAGLAEDVEFHLMLIEAGYRVVFAPEAIVAAEMPSSLTDSHSQNLRWEAGRLATVKAAILILWRGVRGRNLAMVDAAVEQLVPPLSVAMILDLTLLILGALFGVRLVWLASAAMLIPMVLYVAEGVLLAEVSSGVYLALLSAPIYVAWKALVYARAFAVGANLAWVRTSRAGSEKVTRHKNLES
jgi:1,2-diacylglycerol 3-beta-glucosyltransferase